MANFFKKAGWVLLGLFLLSFALLCDYVLPHHKVAYVVGTEVRRLDASGQSMAARPAMMSTRDVYFVNTKHLKDHEVDVFRNENTGFRLPFYFKFDSAETQAKAQALTLEKGQRVLITYYGWRITWFDMYPNIISLKEWSSDEEPFPWFNVIFLGGLFLGVLALVIWIKRKFPKQTPA